MLSLRPTLWSVSLAALTLLGCNKDKNDDDPDPAPTPVECDLNVTFWFKKNGLQYQLSDQFYDTGGHLVRFDKVRLLFSNFRVLDDNNNVTKAFPGVVILADMANGASGTYYLGKVPEGPLHKIAFDIGLDQTTNAMDPSQCSGPPLSDPTLFIDGTQGHRFVTLEGHVDADNDLVVGSSDQAVVYQCTTNAMLRHDEIMTGTSAIGDVGFATVPIGIELMNILNGINMVSAPTAIGAGAPNVQLMSKCRSRWEMNRRAWAAPSYVSRCTRSASR